MDFEKIKQMIQDTIKDSLVEVTDLTGTRDHIGLLIISDEFKGKLLIQQHQMIMDIFKESLKQEMHALQIKTLTKDQAEKQGISIA